MAARFFSLPRKKRPPGRAAAPGRARALRLRIRPMEGGAAPTRPGRPAPRGRAASHHASRPARASAGAGLPPPRRGPPRGGGAAVANPRPGWGTRRRRRREGAQERVGRVSHHRRSEAGGPPAWPEAARRHGGGRGAPRRPGAPASSRRSGRQPRLPAESSRPIACWADPRAKPSKRTPRSRRRRRRGPAAAAGSKLPRPHLPRQAHGLVRGVQARKEQRGRGPGRGVQPEVTVATAGPACRANPTSSRGRSKPATFFTTLPPRAASTPSARTRETPMMRSRADPYRARSGPNGVRRHDSPGGGRPGCGG